MRQNKIKVLNIVGWGRSGSTVLGSVLGEIEGFFFGGEIRNLWNRVLLENRLCGCNKPIKECSVWKKILDNAFDDFTEDHLKQMKELIMSNTRNRHVPLLFLPQSKKTYKLKLKDYLNNLQRLFLSIHETMSSRVIIDSSKSLAYNFMLSLIDAIDLYTIHLIRDPRGVNYSRLKTKVHQDSNNGKTILMKKINPFVNSLMWDLRNVSSELLLNKNQKNHITMRYEDFAKYPKETINKILNLLGEKNLKLPFVSDNAVTLSTNHAVWGNPSRFKTGRVELKLDEEWKTKMKAGDKLLSTVLTWPLLLRYKY